MELIDWLIVDSILYDDRKHNTRTTVCDCTNYCEWYQSNNNNSKF
jgi:hypothetical protein